MQELIVPVVNLQMRPSPKQKKVLKEHYIIELSKDIITNRAFTFTVQYKVAELMFAEMLAAGRKIRVNILKGQHQIGQAVASEYGFDEATKEIILEQNRKNVVTVLLNEDVIEADMSILLVDSRTDLELAKKTDIPVKVLN